MNALGIWIRHIDDAADFAALDLLKAVKYFGADILLFVSHLRPPAKGIFTFIDMPTKLTFNFKAIARMYAEGQTLDYPRASSHGMRPNQQIVVFADGLRGTPAHGAWRG